MQHYRIDYQPQLIEEAVLLAMSGHEDEHVFRWERDQIYESFEPDARDAAFQQVHRSWFDILQMGKPLQACFDTWPILREVTQRCLVMKARSPKDAGAELYRTNERAGRDQRASQIILMQITPALFTRPAACLAFLRHESLHVADMLDPHFEYAPDLPKSNAGPAHDQLLQSRYTVLWDITIDGRLYLRGWLPATMREKHFAKFQRVFPGSEEKLAESFAHFFDRNSHTHPELLAFAQNPEQQSAAESIEAACKSRCAVCRFPVYQLLDPQELQAAVIAEIQKHHPDWNHTKFICTQCADLYEARVLQNETRVFAHHL